MKKLLSILLVLALLVGASVFPTANAAGVDSDMMKYGNPDISYADSMQAPRWVSGTLSQSLTKDMNGVIKFFNQNKQIFKIEDANNELSKVAEKNDELGFKHLKVQQMVKGIPVYGQEYYVHFDKSGKIYTVNGSFDPEAKKYVSTAKLISKEEAIKIAAKQVNYDKLESPINAKLYLYKTENGYIPAYLSEVSFLSPEPGDWMIFISAVDGSVVNMYNNIKTAGKGASSTAATGTGTGILNDTKTLNLLYTGGYYYMTDTTKAMYSSGGTITTYTANNRTRLPGSKVYDTDTIFNSSTQAAAVDAHCYAGKVYDYYYTTLGRNSLDNRGMTINSTVHYGNRYNNAFWNGKQMVYGDGDGVNYRAFSASLDVIGHEMTHGVTDKEAGLIYQDQSGALSESLSDLFGCFIENRNWTMGEDICIRTTGLRSVDNPGQYGDPDNMSEYVYTTSDNGGVHTNCGIPNKAGSTIAKSLGNLKATKIYYRAIVNYLTSRSTFSDARAAVLQSAADLYGANSTEYTTCRDAFTSVGIN